MLRRQAGKGGEELGQGGVRLRGADTGMEMEEQLREAG
jgi:hypothetical protein